jgi:hypothetical protein
MGWLTTLMRFDNSFTLTIGEKQYKFGEGRTRYVLEDEIVKLAKNQEQDKQCIKCKRIKAGCICST